MTFHAETGVNTEVLRRDAKNLGIDLDNIGPIDLGVVCDQLIRAVNERRIPEGQRPVISQVFNWGLFYVTKTMQNKKAPTAYSIAFVNESTYHNTAILFRSMLSLFAES